ncbi:MAG: HAMP domain-containing histidine kinase [Desulfobacteraceae bacterium]|nr:HAMP domain-containing histidine kinase [Desulfobacteraceae bacterium]MBC2755634.1 HAMP domain-containing histidine kinase [Desulfobacteraceae bacterium]
MKRIKYFMIIFFICLSIPLGYFILRTHQSLDQEEMAELRYFADTLFYEMEKELSALVLKEEGRAIEEYTSFSGLSALPEENYILGYFQNNPDGSFQTPLASDIIALPDSKKPDPKNEEIKDVISQLEDVNRIFNTRRADVSEPFEVSPPEKVLLEKVLTEKEEEFTLAGRYLDLSRSKKKKDYLGQEKKRVENITADQAIKLSKQEQVPAELFKTTKERGAEPEIPAGEIADKDAYDAAASGKSVSDFEKYAWLETADEFSAPAPAILKESNARQVTGRDLDTSVFRVEVDPMQSVFVSDENVVFFRRIVINDRVYRQGFVLLIHRFLNHITKSHFTNQPMSKFTSLDLSIMKDGIRQTIVETGSWSKDPKFSLNHTFPRPFAFLNARLISDNIPRSPGRQTLNIMMTIMALVILMGLFAIYRSVYAIVGLAERRSQFVSSVTHELKTPLTNIRMYIEMLEQKIASSPEREQDYFRILGSESSRLSRLINNVLEYSRLEKKNRRLELSEGAFDDVISEVKGIMCEKLRQEGFEFDVENTTHTSFMYDREVMIQVLINLIENSMKFGKNNAEKKIALVLEPEASQMKISLSDTGPGIPKHALKKVFDDFFRVDNELTRTTGGTGIGLALVNKFVKAMGGRVEAKNNKGPGCTISIFLPIRNP